MADLGTLQLLVQLSEGNLLTQADQLGAKAGARLASAFNKEFAKGVRDGLKGVGDGIGEGLGGATEKFRRSVKPFDFKFIANTKNIDEIIKQISTIQDKSKVQLNISANAKDLPLIEAKIAKIDGTKINFDIKTTGVDNLSAVETKATELRRNSNFSVQVNNTRAIEAFDQLKQSAFGVHAALRATFGGFFASIGAGFRRSLTNSIGSGFDFIGDSVKEFEGFGGALNQFATFSRGTTEEVKALADEAKRLGIETTKTPKEAAEAAIEITKLGFSASQTKDQLSGVIALSESTGLKDIGKAASIAGAAYQVFGTDAKRTADIVSAAANNSAINAYDMQQAFSKAGLVYKQRGQDIETLATAFSLVRGAGASAERAGTGVATVMTRLAAPTDKAKALMKDLGFSFYDAAGKPKPLLAAIAELKPKLENLTPSKRANFEKVIFGAGGASAAASLIDAVGAKTDELYNKIKNSSGDAAESSKKLMGGLAGANTFFKGSLATFQTSIGQALAPAIEGILRTATDVLNNLLKGDLFKSLETGMGRFRDLLTGTPEIAQTLSNAMAQIVSLISGGLVEYTRQFTEYLSQNPQAIATLASDLVGVAKTIGDITQMALEFGKGFAQGFGDILNITRPILEFFGQLTGATEGTKSIAESFGRIAAYAVPITLLVNGLLGISAVVGAVQNIAIAVEAIGGIGAILNPVTLTIAAIALTVKNIIDYTNNWDDVVLGIKQTIEDLKGVFNNLYEQSGLFKTVWEGAKAIISAALSPFTSVIGTLDSLLNISGLIKGAWDQLVDAIGRGVNFIKQAHQAAVGLLSTLLKASGIKLPGQGKPTEVKKGVGSGFEDLGKGVESQTKSPQKSNPAKVTPSKIEASVTTDDQLNEPPSKKEQEKAAREQAKAARDAARAKEQAETEALNRVKEANERADLAIVKSAQDRTVTVKQLVLDGKLTEEQAATRLSQVEVSTTVQQIDAKRKQVAEIQKLRNSGQIDAKKAAKEEIELQKQIGQLNLQRIEKELAAQRALRAEKIKALEEETATRKAPLEGKASQLGFDNTSIQNQTNLLQAQLGLNKAIYGLEQQRLEFALEDARKRGDSLAVSQLQERLFKSQNDELAAQQKTANELLALSNQEKLNQLEIQRTQAEIAKIEAEAAVQKAEIEGRSQAEVQRLKDIVDLRQRVVNQVQDQLENQKRLNGLTEEEIRLNQQKEKERLLRNQQNDRDKDTSKPTEPGTTGSGTTGSGLNNTGATGSGVSISGQSLADYNKTKPLFDQLLKESKTTGELQTNLLKALSLTGSQGERNALAQMAQSYGQGDLAAKVLQLQEKGIGNMAINKAIAESRNSNQDLLTVMNGLRGDINRLANSPRVLNVSAPDPVGDVGQISADLAKRNLYSSRI